MLTRTKPLKRSGIRRTGKKHTPRLRLDRMTWRQMEKHLPPEQLDAQKAKPNSKYWLSRADDSWKLATKIWHGYQCCICGKTRFLNSHHLIGRSEKHTRHMISNCMVLCPYHHKLSSKLSAHGAPEGFREWFLQEHPRWFEIIDELRKFPFEGKPDYRKAAMRLEKYIARTKESDHD